MTIFNHCLNSSLEKIEAENPLYWILSGLGRGGGLAVFSVFSIKSLHIMLVLPHAAQIKHIFLCRKIIGVAPPRGLWSRTHYWGIETEEKSPGPGGNWTHDLKSFAPQVYAPPLCYNHCPGSLHSLNRIERSRVQFLVSPDPGFWKL